MSTRGARRSRASAASAVVAGYSLPRWYSQGTHSLEGTRRVLPRWYSQGTHSLDGTRGCSLGGTRRVLPPLRVLAGYSLPRWHSQGTHSLEGTRRVLPPSMVLAGTHFVALAGYSLPRWYSRGARGVLEYSRTSAVSRAEARGATQGSTANTREYSTAVRAAHSLLPRRDSGAAAVRSGTPGGTRAALLAPGATAKGSAAALRRFGLVWHRSTDPPPIVYAITGNSRLTIPIAGCVARSVRGAACTGVGYSE